MRFGVLVRKKDGSPSFANFKQVGKFWGALTEKERQRASQDFDFTYEEKVPDLVIRKDGMEYTFLGATKE